MQWIHLPDTGGESIACSPRVELVSLLCLYTEPLRDSRSVGQEFVTRL